jgi:hypothetical protein
MGRGQEGGGGCCGLSVHPTLSVYTSPPPPPLPPLTSSKLQPIQISSMCWHPEPIQPIFRTLPRFKPLGECVRGHRRCPASSSTLLELGHRVCLDEQMHGYAQTQTIYRGLGPSTNGSGSSGGGGGRLGSVGSIGSVGLVWLCWLVGWLVGWLSGWLVGWLDN